MFQVTNQSINIRLIKAEIAVHQYRTIITSISLIWQFPLDQRRRNARLTLFYKCIHGVNSIPVHHLRQPTRHTRQCGTHTFTSLSSRTNVYKYSYFPRTAVDWNALPSEQHSTDYPPLHPTPTAPWHSGSNGSMPMAGYQPKNRRTKQQALI